VDRAAALRQGHDATTACEASFDALVAHAADGDDRAFEQLIGPLIPSLRGYLRGIGRDETEDLLDDVLLAVFTNLARFRGGEESLRSWVFAIAHNRAVDHHRRRRRRAEIDGELAVAAAARPELRTVASAEQFALDHVAEAEMLEVLAALPPAQRQVLLLRTVADLSVEQTAAVMGRSNGAVKLLQHRAVTSLRRRLAPVEHDGADGDDGDDRDDDA
jgi:RNA polymerase sigma-70 factor (ECF subfamily)